MSSLYMHVVLNVREIAAIQDWKKERAALKLAFAQTIYIYEKLIIFASCPTMRVIDSARARIDASKREELGRV